MALVTVPHWPAGWVLAPLCIVQACQLGSYAVSDAAMLERVAPGVRGRVVGVFLTLAGTIASMGPWSMGYWTDRLGPERASTAGGYAWPFATLGILMAVGALATPLIARLGSPTAGAVRPADEIAPATLEPMG
jgi:hypothetical protein